MFSADESAAVAVVSRSTPAGLAVKGLSRVSSSTPIMARHQPMMDTLQVLLTAMFVFELPVPSFAGTGEFLSLRCFILSPGFCYMTVQSTDPSALIKRWPRQAWRGEPSVLAELVFPLLALPIAKFDSGTVVLDAVAILCSR